MKVETLLTVTLFVDVVWLIRVWKLKDRQWLGINTINFHIPFTKPKGKEAHTTILTIVYER